MKIDIDKLHRVIDNLGNLPRRSGKTFARCHQVAGFVELGYKDIFCKITRQSEICYLKSMLRDALKEHGIELKRTRSLGEYTADGSLIRLISQDFEQKTRGYEAVVVPMGQQI